MADLSDVLTAIRDAVSAALYPGGVPAGPAPATIAGVPARIFVGWPSADLDADLKKGIAQISIWPRPGMSRQIGPYLHGWEDVAGPTPSLSATVLDEAVTFTGTGAAPAMIAAVIVDRAPYTYPLLAGDGPEQVAAALAALVAVDRPASATGAVLSVPGAFSLVARVVAGGTERKEVRRVAQSIQISVWASRPSVRDALTMVIDAALEGDMRTLALPDGTKATLTYEGTAYEEDARQQPLHRRDLFVSAEYSMTLTRAVPGIAVTVPELSIEGAVGFTVVVPAGPGLTPMVWLDFDRPANSGLAALL